MCWFGSWSMWLSLFGRVGCEGSLSCREGWHEVLIPWLLFLDVGVVKGAPLSSLVRWWWFFWIFFLVGLEGRMLHRAALISDHRVKVLHSASWISWWNGTWLISHRFRFDICLCWIFPLQTKQKKGFSLSGQPKLQTSTFVYICHICQLICSCMSQHFQLQTTKSPLDHQTIVALPTFAMMMPYLLLISVLPLVQAQLLVASNFSTLEKWAKVVEKGFF